MKFYDQEDVIEIGEDCENCKDPAHWRDPEGVPLCSMCAHMLEIED